MLSMLIRKMLAQAQECLFEHITLPGIRNEFFSLLKMAQEAAKVLDILFTVFKQCFFVHISQLLLHEASFHEYRDSVLCVSMSDSCIQIYDLLMLSVCGCFKPPPTFTPLSGVRVVVTFILFCSQVAETYSQVYQCMIQNPIKNNVPFFWSTMCQLKTSHYSSLAHYFVSTALLDHQRKSRSRSRPLLVSNWPTAH